VTSLFVSQNFATQAIGGGAALEGHSWQSSGSATLPRDHSSQVFAVVATPANPPSESSREDSTPRGQEGQHAWTSQELVDLIFIDDLLDGHSNTRSGSAAVFPPDAQ
jgi:hypothetical protein